MNLNEPSTCLKGRTRNDSNSPTFAWMTHTSIRILLIQDWFILSKYIHSYIILYHQLIICVFVILPFFMVSSSCGASSHHFDGYITTWHNPNLVVWLLKRPYHHLKNLEFVSGCIHIILHTVSHIENLYWDESHIPYFPIHPDTSQTGGEPPDRSKQLLCFCLEQLACNRWLSPIYFDDFRWFSRLASTWYVTLKKSRLKNHSRKPRIHKNSQSTNNSLLSIGTCLLYYCCIRLNCGIAFDLFLHRLGL